MDLKVFTNYSELEKITPLSDFVDFLYENLDEFGDTKEAITACVAYAFSEEAGKGGFLIGAYEDGKMLGALIMNETGMAGYIPENILVYIAVSPESRGKGLGRKIIEESYKYIKGNVALHVEYENPAKRLYERLGFTSKYAEMRLVR